MTGQHDGAAARDVARGHGVLIEAGRVFYDQPPYPCPQFRLMPQRVPMRP